MDEESLQTNRIKPYCPGNPTLERRQCVAPLQNEWLQFFNRLLRRFNARSWAAKPLPPSPKASWTSAPGTNLLRRFRWFGILSPFALTLAGLRQYTLTRAVSVPLSSRLRERTHENTSPLKLPMHRWRAVILCPLRRPANSHSRFCIPEYHRAGTSRLCRQPLMLIIGLLLPFHFSIQKCWPS